MMTKSQSCQWALTAIKPANPPPVYSSTLLQVLATCEHLADGSFDVVVTSPIMLVVDKHLAVKPGQLAGLPAYPETNRHAMCPTSGNRALELVMRAILLEYCQKLHTLRLKIKTQEISSGRITESINSKSIWRVS